MSQAFSPCFPSFSRSARRGALTRAARIVANESNATTAIFVLAVKAAQPACAAFWNGPSSFSSSSASRLSTSWCKLLTSSAATWSGTPCGAQLVERAEERRLGSRSAGAGERCAESAGLEPLADRLPARLDIAGQPALWPEGRGGGAADDHRNRPRRTFQHSGPRHDHRAGDMFQESATRARMSTNADTIEGAWKVVRGRGTRPLRHRRSGRGRARVVICPGNRGDLPDPGSGRAGRLKQLIPCASIFSSAPLHALDRRRRW